MLKSRLIIAALLIRLLVIPFFFHPDLKSQYFHFQFLSSGVTNIYQYISDHRYDLPYRDSFNYLPLTYFSFGSYYAVIKLFTPPDLGSWLNYWGDFQNSNPNLPFFLIYLKFPYLIFDFITGYVLYKLYKSKQLLYLWFFNPVSIYLIYVLGNFDIFPVFFTLLAYYLLTVNRTRLSFFSLGIAVALKLYPLLFLPFFLLYRRQNLRQIIINTLATFIPLVITVLPFAGFSSFQTSFFGSGLTQKIIEFKLSNVPLFPLSYLVLLFSFFVTRNNLLKDYHFEKYILGLLLLFISLVNFHPQWLLWFFPFVIPIYYFHRSLRIRLLTITILVFIYISLFNDQYLFWGHLIPVDTAFADAVSPYRLVNKLGFVSADFIRRLLHPLFMFTFLILSFLPYAKKKI